MKKNLLCLICYGCILFSFLSCEHSSPHKGVVTFYGMVIDRNGEPVSGVQVKIGGSDTPGGSTVTGSNGVYELPLSIIPNERGSSLVFVIAATKIDYNNYFLSDFNIDYRYFPYIGGNAGERIAYAAQITTDWNAVGEQIQHSFNINTGGFR